jgi:hypothetical protein
MSELATNVFVDCVVYIVLPHWIGYVLTVPYHHVVKDDARKYCLLDLFQVRKLNRSCQPSKLALEDSKASLNILA